MLQLWPVLGGAECYWPHVQLATRDSQIGASGRRMPGGACLRVVMHTPPMCTWWGMGSMHEVAYLSIYSVSHAKMWLFTVATWILFGWNYQQSLPAPLSPW